MKMNEKPYTQQELELLIESTVQSILSLVRIKGVEYSGPVDCLANFRRNAERLGVTPELIWAVYAGKHWDAIQTWAQNCNRGIVQEHSEPIPGRMDDLITYLILAKALFNTREVQQLQNSVVERIVGTDRTGGDLIEHKY